MTEAEKYVHTSEIYNEYHRRMYQAVLDRPQRHPWQRKDAEEIVTELKTSLGIRDEWIPEIHEEILETREYDGYTFYNLQYYSWENCWGGASLYVPTSGTGPYPAVVFCCGHGAQGRYTPGYHAMGRRLARQGAVVLINDNLGQGTREKFGHWDSVGPFYCGTSTQGLIVMETIGWIHHLAKYPNVDASRIGACGNSGGGALTMFLCALAQKELRCICSTGFPSSFHWLVAKERRHCGCNLIPHSLNKFEMWELFSLYAPKPLMLLQGYFDYMLPQAVFYSNARNVKTTYEALEQGQNFFFEVCSGEHPLDCARRFKVCNFMAEHLQFGPAEEMENDCVDLPPMPEMPFPENALSTDELAQQLTGITMPEGTMLWDIYPPTYQGEKVDPETITTEAFRGLTMRVFAQMECFL